MSTGLPSYLGAQGSVGVRGRVLLWGHSIPWEHRQSRLCGALGDTYGDGGIGDVVSGGIFEGNGGISGGEDDD